VAEDLGGAVLGVGAPGSAFFDLASGLLVRIN
jgi:hypothetical protein